MGNLITILVIDLLAQSSEIIFGHHRFHFKKRVKGSDFGEINVADHDLKETLPMQLSGKCITSSSRLQYIDLQIRWMDRLLDDSGRHVGFTFREEKQCLA